MILRQRCLFQEIGSLCLVLGLILLIMDQAEAAWEMTPSLALSISGRYDSNVESKETAESDMVTTVTPQFNISLKRHETRIRIGGATETEFFTEKSELNQTSIYLSSTFNQSLSPITSLALSETIRFTPESRSLIEVSEEGEPLENGEGENTITVRRSNRVINNTSIKLSHRSSTRTTESIRYVLQLVEFEDQDLLDTRLHEGSLNLDHQINRTNAIAAGYRYRYFDNRETDDSPSGVDADDKKTEDSQAHGLTFGLDHTFSPSLTMGGSLILEYVIEPMDSTVTVGGGANLSKTLEGLFDLRMGYTVDVSPSGGISEDLVRTHVVRTSVTKTISRNLKATITGIYADNRSISSDRVEINSWSGIAGLTYNLRPWLSLGLSYSHLDQDSHGREGNDVVRDQYGFNLTAVFL
jgi:outer membrane receptor protein involved in Fe transport